MTTQVMPTGQMHSYSQPFLQATISDTEKLIDFLKELRANSNSLKLNKVNKLFTEKAIWKNRRQGNGHNEYMHMPTGIVIEYSARNNPLEKGAVVTLTNNLQGIVNCIYYKQLKISPRMRKDSAKITQCFQKLQSQKMSNKAEIKNLSMYMQLLKNRQKSH